MCVCVCVCVCVFVFVFVFVCVCARLKHEPYFHVTHVSISACARLLIDRK